MCKYPTISKILFTFCSRAFPFSWNLFVFIREFQEWKVNLCCVLLNWKFVISYSLLDRSTRYISISVATNLPRAGKKTSVLMSVCVRKFRHWILSEFRNRSHFFFSWDLKFLFLVLFLYCSISQVIIEHLFSVDIWALNWMVRLCIVCLCVCCEWLRLYSVACVWFDRFRGCRPKTHKKRRWKWHTHTK